MTPTASIASVLTIQNGRPSRADVVLWHRDQGTITQHWVFGRKTGHCRVPLIGGTDQAKETEKVTVVFVRDFITSAATYRHMNSKTHEPNAPTTSSQFSSANLLEMSFFLVSAEASTLLVDRNATTLIFCVK